MKINNVDSLIDLHISYVARKSCETVYWSKDHKAICKKSFFSTIFLKRSLSSPELYRSDLRTGLRTADFCYSLFLEKEKINNLQFLANTEKISVAFSETRE